MNYVVVDLEWNQAMSSKSSVFNKLPIHLGGEIIEIGAVKLTDDMQPGEEFTIEGKELLARAFCHELDHLDGVVFKSVCERMLRPEEIEQ